ncbi:MAG TPA: YCF48-related protein [Bacteroidia bacterium]|nr:YCF48-related protein [Bacteroidia bacterium]
MKKFTFKKLVFGFSTIAMSLLFFQCSKNNTTTITIPTLTTMAITPSSTSQFVATSGGNISSAGNGTITAYGICYSSTNQNPDLTCEYTNDGQGAATNYTSYITDFSPNTTYYIRAYATNSAGTGYGNLIQYTTGTANWASVYFISNLKALSGISFSDDNHGWAYGINTNNQVVLITSVDGGTTWTTSTNPVNTNTISLSLTYNGAYLPTKNKSICFTNLGDGWIVYGGDSVLTTQNGGVTWSLVPYTTSAPVPGQGLNSLSFYNSLTGVVSGLGLYKTVGGTSWTNQANAATYFNSVYFTSQNIGFAGTNTGIYKSIDGGNTWTAIANTTSPIYGFYFANGVLYAAGSQSLLISTDQGVTWTNKQAPNNGGSTLYNVCFINQNFGVAATQTGLYQTYDGGNTWAIINTSGAFNDVCRTSNHVFAISGTSILKM